MWMTAIGAAALLTGTIVAPAPASAAVVCAVDYKVLSVSIKYKACINNSFNASVLNYGIYTNDHGSPVTVNYQTGFKDLTTGKTTWQANKYAATWPAGRGEASVAFGISCTPGHAVRALFKVQYKNNWGAVSESSTVTCPR